MPLEIAFGVGTMASGLGLAATQGLPYNLNLLLAIVAGIAGGMIVRRLRAA